jgi:hypothetical protein
VYVTQQRVNNGQFQATDLFATNLQPYAERINDVAGQRGLVATSLYVVVSIAALLGVALIRRSGAANERGPRYLLLGLIGLSFAILFSIISVEMFHQYIALTTIPLWGWIAALGATVGAAALELLRQRLDPIFPPSSVAERSESTAK